ERQSEQLAIEALGCLDVVSRDGDEVDAGNADRGHGALLTRGCAESLRTTARRPGRRRPYRAAGMDFMAMMELDPRGPDVYVGVGPEYPGGGLFEPQITAQCPPVLAPAV